MLVGLGGAALLFAPDMHTHTFHAGLLSGFLVLQLGMAGWAFGSIYQRRRVSGAHPIVIGAVQQLAAGLSFLPLALLFHEHPVHWSLRGVSAILYLVMFGSIVGYSAYIFALDRLPVAIVSIYPYVNSVVAVTLGWLFYREPFGSREAAAMAVIFTGVALVKRYSRPLTAPARGLPTAAFGPGPVTPPTSLAPSAPPAVHRNVMIRKKNSSAKTTTNARPLGFSRILRACCTLGSFPYILWNCSS